MISPEDFFGGGAETSFGSNITLAPGTDPRMQRLTATTTSLVVTIAAPRSSPARNGGPLFVIWNAGANTFTIEDEATTTLATVVADDIATVCSVDDGTEAWTNTANSLFAVLETRAT